MKSIFELVDSSKQTFYYYFDRKEPLLPLDRVLIKLKSVKNAKEKAEILKALDSSSSFFDIAKSYPDESTATEDNFVIAYLREDWKLANSTKNSCRSMESRTYSYLTGNRTHTF